MKDRTIRFGFTGLTFILSILLGFWLLGGNIFELLKTVNIDFNKTDKTIWVSAIGVFISSPLLGFVLSSITHIILGRWEFLPPKREYEQMYLGRLFFIFGRIVSGVEFENNEFRIARQSCMFLRGQLRIIHINHQVLFRKNASDEMINFTQRRMDFFWTHVNTLFAIILGFIFGLVLQFSQCHFQVVSYQYPAIKIFSLVIIVLYFVTGIWMAIKNLKESNDFEKRTLLRYF